jgi:hypothetical protein
VESRIIAAVASTTRLAGNIVELRTIAAVEDQMFS